MASGKVCQHVVAENLRKPTPLDSVYREDCTQCFDSIDEPAGLDVCLKCFNGGCNGIYNHAQAHYTSSEHPLVLNIRRVRKVVVRDEPPLKMSKLQINAETEADRYDTILTLNCRACNETDLDKSNELVEPVISAVMKAATFATKQEIVAWSNEIRQCEHITALISLDEEQAKNNQAFEKNQTLRNGEEGMAVDSPEQNGQADKKVKRFESSNLNKCSQCTLTQNLWLCLTCGNVGCGRDQSYGGLVADAPKGNGHASAHGADKEHHLNVKLGSLSYGETPDVWCYACGDKDNDGKTRGNETTHPDLFDFLERNGLNVRERQKTEKSLVESQIELNLKQWNFSMTNQEGKEATPLFGPGLTGLRNMGNTCYLASILQCLYDIPAFQKRFNLPADQVPHPAEDLETQLRKVADGLLSGRYSNPDSDLMISEHSSELPYQKGLTPAMLKHLIGRDHEEFSTSRQQDAYELMQHLLDKIATLQHPKEVGNPSEVFRFAMEQRLQCRSCFKVRYTTENHENLLVNVPVDKLPSQGEEKDIYRPVPLKECLDILTAQEDVDLKCSYCGSDGFTKRQLFKTFPQVLVIVARKIMETTPYNYVKVDVPVIVDDGPIDFDAYFSTGKQPGEDLLEDDPKPKGPAFDPNPTALGQLTDMGFPEGRVIKALFHTGNSDLNAAMEWIMAHMDDEDIDGPLQTAPAENSSDSIVKEEDVQNLLSWGFDEQTIRKALFKHGGDVQTAANGILEGNSYDDVTLPEPKKNDGKAQPNELPGSTDRPAKFQLQSIVCHKGNSIHAGHYVAFIRKQIDGKPSWVLFNDEKVAVGVDAEEMTKSAYVYFFKRV
ncbi:hypothetical protein V8F20_009238 [Naviculisporaceae sp. PSN 640]